MNTSENTTGYRDIFDTVLRDIDDSAVKQLIN